MTAQQINWAKTHDWFSHCVAHGVCVIERSSDANGELTEELRIFTDFRALRIWAGY